MLVCCLVPEDTRVSSQQECFGCLNYQVLDEDQVSVGNGGNEGVDMSRLSPLRQSGLFHMYAIVNRGVFERHVRGDAKHRCNRICVLNIRHICTHGSSAFPWLHRDMRSQAPVSRRVIRADTAALHACNRPQQQYESLREL